MSSTLGFQWSLQADDEAHVIGVARPEARETGVGQVREPSVAPPGLVDLQMPAVMLPGGAAVVAHWCPAPDGEDFMDLDRRVVASSGKVVEQGIADRHRRGINDVPILYPAQGAWQVDLLGPGVRQGALRQGRHTLLEGHIEPPIERGARDPWHFTLQVGAQDIRLIGAARRPRRNDHRPHQRPKVQLALPLDHPALLAQTINLLLRQHRLEHGPHVVACHVLSPSDSPVIGAGHGPSRQGLDPSAILQSRRADPRSLGDWLKYTRMSPGV